MGRDIYVQLMNEGTIVYRPVPAIEIEKNIFELGGHQIYNSEAEHWEFLPGTLVVVEEKDFSDGIALVAIRQFND